MSLATNTILKEIRDTLKDISVSLRKLSKRDDEVDVDKSYIPSWLDSIQREKNDE